MDTIQITDNICIPVPAGNGQYGNEKFLSEGEKENIYHVFEFTGKEVPEGKGGLVVQMRKNGKMERILYIADDKHSFNACLCLLI